MTKLFKRRVVFALVMGLVTTGLISFSVVAVNLGFPSGFVPRWLRSWIFSYLLVVPIILLIGPKVQAFVDRRIN